jgi:hypothetical protein
VTSAWLVDGREAAGDPVVGAVLADSDRLAPAKLVDLDPEQQLVSMIWGLEVRIADPEGQNLLRGRFEPAAFMDIWDRAQGGGGGSDSGAGAMYQSVLTDLEWGDVESSAVLSSLREAADSGLLSIKFNVDGLSLDRESPDFLMGRIVGTIGPAVAGEPWHFVRGRQFLARPRPGGSFFVPADGLNCYAGVVDPVAKQVHLDLGNALPTATPGGRMADLGTLTLNVLFPGRPLLPLDAMPAAIYTSPDWYSRTAGIVSFPVDRPMTDDELAGVQSARLVLTGTLPAGATTGVAESPGGVYVRADQFVFRLDPGDEAVVHLHATRFGRPYPRASVLALRYAAELQPRSRIGAAPTVATPEEAIRFPVQLVTDEDGRAVLRVCAEDPGTPRGYIDGQVYGLYPVLEETVVLPDNPYPFDEWAFISLLVWSGFEADEPPTWFGSIQPILQQYANLYPVMDRFLDLGDYDSVCANLGLLELSFGLDLRDPNSMPVTRDLSTAKREAILRWLREPGEDGKPRRGTPRKPAPVEAETTMPELAADGEGAGPPLVLPQQGGKASAVGRRLGAYPAAAGVPEGSRPGEGVR